MYQSDLIDLQQDWCLVQGSPYSITEPVGKVCFVASDAEVAGMALY